MTHIEEYLPEYAVTLMKLAMGSAPAKEPGSYEKYLPWYGAAGLGMAGHEVGKMLPKKYQMLGRIGGTLLGTGIGVHGGEAIGKKLDKPKVAGVLKKAYAQTELGSPTKKKEEKKSKAKEVAKTVGTGLAGLATGTLAGYGAGKLADLVAQKAGRKIPAKYIVPIATVAGAGLGTVNSMWKAHELEALKRALED